MKQEILSKDNSKLQKIGVKHMINTDYLDQHIEKIGGLHPQVLIKLKEQALGAFLAGGMIFNNENTTNDYYNDCVKIFDFIFSSGIVDKTEEEFENAWVEFVGDEPVKWEPFENETWAAISDRIWDYYETLKTTAEMVISLQALGPIANLIPAVTPKVENV